MTDDYTSEGYAPETLFNIIFLFPQILPNLLSISNILLLLNTVMLKTICNHKQNSKDLISSQTIHQVQYNVICSI